MKKIHLLSIIIILTSGLSQAQPCSFTAVITTSPSVTCGEVMKLNSIIPSGGSAQWLNNGAPIPGASSAIYSVASIGSYSVILSDGNGCTVTSSSIGVSGTIPSAVTITQQPDASSGKDAVLVSDFPSVNFGSSFEFNALAVSGGTHRSILKFDLGFIPVNGVITNSKLSLYFDPTSSNGAAHVSASNSTYIRRITGSWDENVVTWNTQPASTTTNQSLISPVSGTQDLTNINVTALVNDMKSAPGNDNGFLFGLQAEQITKKVLCASSDNPLSAKHPKLEVTISLPWQVTPVMITTSPATVCGEILNLNTTVPSGGSVKWLNNGIIIQGATASLYSVTSLGSYSVVLTDTNGCIDTSSSIGVSGTIPSSITVTQQPDASSGKDALIPSDLPTVNFGSTYEFNALAVSGGIHRSILKFDLGFLPPNNVIADAKLSLYFDPTSSNGSAHVSASNSTYLRRITGSWDENLVTWNTQPASTTTNQALISPISGTQDLTNINVTALVNDMKSAPGNDNGFLFGLQAEQITKKVLCASSDHPIASRHPKLEVTFSLPQLQSNITITGTTGFCRPSTGNIYTASSSIAGTTYNWTVPAGATITSGQGTSSITVSFASNAAAGNISVTATNSCGSTPASKAIVIRSAVSATPGAITGSNVGCNGDCKQYTIRKVSTADYYIWTPPAGATINGSSSPFSTADTGVVVCYGPSFTGDSLRVKSGNCKGVSAERKLRINKTNPATPGTISGINVGLCNLSGVAYTINAVNNATSYTWRTNIAGALINGSASPVTTSNSVSVNFGTFTTGQIYVKANNACGSSAERSLTVNAKPAVPASITGPATLCDGQTGVNYSTIAVNNASSYNWTVPSGSSIPSGQGTLSMMMNAGVNPTSGSVRVRAQNVCGNSAYLSKAITINNCPRLEDATSGSHDLYIEAYPIPATGILNIAVETETQESYRFDLTDISGRTIRTWNENISSGRSLFEVNIDNFPSGVYHLTVAGNRDILQRIKVVVQ